MGEPASSSVDQGEGRKRHMAKPYTQSRAENYDDIDVEVLEETSPVNRPPREPETDEEKHQAMVENICSQCRHGRSSEIKKAIEQGLAVDTTDRHGNTLLIIACQNNHKKIVKILVRAGADISLKNHKAHDAYHYAQLYKHAEVLPYVAPPTAPTLNS